MRLLVLGASGQVGRHLVRQAHERGHAVTAVVRGDDPVQGAERVVRGDVTAAGVVESTVPGHDAVISCLGLKRKTTWNPYSKLVSPEDLASAVTRRLVSAMAGAGISRVVAVSTAGAGDSYPAMNAMMRFLVSTSSIGAGYRDLARMEEVLAGSGLDWCAVRPVTLTDAAGTQRVRLVDHFGATMTIPRADVAWWMLERVEGRALTVIRTPQIASA